MYLFNDLHFRETYKKVSKYNQLHIFRYIATT